MAESDKKGTKKTADSVSLLDWPTSNKTPIRKTARSADRNNCYTRYFNHLRREFEKADLTFTMQDYCKVLQFSLRETTSRKKSMEPANIKGREISRSQLKSENKLPDVTSLEQAIGFTEKGQSKKKNRTLAKHPHVTSKPLISVLTAMSPRGKKYSLHKLNEDRKAAKTIEGSFSLNQDMKLHKASDLFVSGKSNEINVAPSELESQNQSKNRKIKLGAKASTYQVNVSGPNQTAVRSKSYILKKPRAYSIYPLRSI